MKKSIRLIPLFLIFGIIFFWQNNKSFKNELIHIEGTTMGNIGYNVKYIKTSPNGEIMKSEIDSLLILFNKALSTYIDSSEISIFNHNGLVRYKSDFFYQVLNKSKEVYNKTDGAFDPTVMPLVNAWGFGPSFHTTPDSLEISEIMNYVGFENIFFDSVSVCKLEEGVALDFSAIAKGYAVDLLVELLANKGIDNMFVEIGGEVAAKGRNLISDDFWIVGVENPTKSAFDREMMEAFRLDDLALATSGNYRNFREEDGKIIVHTINPKTGYPVIHNLLSASVFANTCMEADAFATAFMVMGLSKSIEILEGDPNLEGLLIYSDNEGNLATYQSEKLNAYRLN